MKGIILTLLIVLSGCSTVNKSDYSGAASVIDKRILLQGSRTSIY